ncbi:hypothetical protein SISSUDRAFT_1063574 [Sistotremastrum suecicum HHB10207 ss-3]|uniref:F-box domain-containing protein n=1 Tax=Sistotremastrum suecicum HHB10207 ss-3 TaxID=1314776 RepID=A0A166BMZ0_9AGAM|nr:hypothetical protein SISSUDRAFT_1063574 [Sistotremastrum suecicum HHB10207 ss-3]
MKLPLELLIKILEELDYEPLKACMRVSKSLSNVIKESSVLQYHIQLFSRGFIDGVSELSHLQSITSKQQALLDLQDTWSDLRPRRQTRLPPSPKFSLGKLIGGICATYDDRNSEGTSITFTTLPSVARNIELREQRIKLTTKLIEFTIDPSQDLLVLVEKSRALAVGYRFHFRTMSQNTPHPQALKETIEYHPPDDLVEELSIQISGQRIIVLVILYDADGERDFTILGAWDWHAGNFLASYDGGKRVVCSFAHITPSRFMLAEYFLYPRHLARHDPHIRLALLDLCEKPDGNYHFVHVESLLLPPIECPKFWGECRVSEFDIHPDIGPVVTHELPNHPSPFHPDPTHRLFLVTLSLTDDTDFVDPILLELNFCIPFDTISKAAPIARSMSIPSELAYSNAQARHDNSDCHVVLPLRGSRKRIMPESVPAILSAEPIGVNWAAWGRKGVSVIEFNGCACFVFGMRCVALESLRGSATQANLVVLDFSPFAVSACKQATKEAEFSKAVFYASDIFEYRKIFIRNTDEEEKEEEREKEALSFVEMKRVIPCASDVFMDMENIVISRYDREHHHLDVEVWTM